MPIIPPSALHHLCHLTPLLYTKLFFFFGICGFSTEPLVLYHFLKKIKTKRVSDNLHRLCDLLLSRIKKSWILSRLFYNIFSNMILDIFGDTSSDYFLRTYSKHSVTGVTRHNVLSYLFLSSQNISYPSYSFLLSLNSCNDLFLIFLLTSSDWLSCQTPFFTSAYTSCLSFFLH